VLGEVGASGYTYFGDGHGSTRQLMNGDGSGVAEDGVSQREQYYDYDAYGEAFGWELDDPDSGVSRPLTDLLYAGEQWDAELGMQYLRARYYMPEQGVFNRVDPFPGNTGDPQSLHKYAYTHGDPVNGIDPSGLFSIGTALLSTAIFVGLASMGISAALSAFVTGGNILATAVSSGVTGFLSVFLAGLMPLAIAFAFFIAGFLGALVEIGIDPVLRGRSTLYQIGYSVVAGGINTASSGIGWLVGRIRGFLNPNLGIEPLEGFGRRLVDLEM